MLFVLRRFCSDINLFISGVGLKQTLTNKLHDAGVSEELTFSMATNMAGYLLQSKADSTVRKYSLTFAQFEKYCDLNSLVSKPASPVVVAMYITHLLDQGKTESVISSAVYGIKWAHNVNDLADPTDSNIVNL